jgi:hypothetical protein
MSMIKHVLSMHAAMSSILIYPTKKGKKEGEKYVVFFLNWVFFSTLFWENEEFENILIQLVLVQDFISTYLYVECYGVQEK